MEAQDKDDKNMADLVHLFTVAAHASEKSVKYIEEILTALFKKCRGYEQSCQRDGEEAASKKLDRQVQQGVRYKSGTQMGKVLKEMESMKKAFMKLTVNSVTTMDDKMHAEFYDGLHEESNRLCWIYLKLCNTPQKNWLKLESTIKALATEHNVSDEIIDLFTPQH